jgi:phosphohistidine phosphatase
MLVYLLRHGIAEDHGFRGTDAERQLTEEGRAKTAAALRSVASMRFATPMLVISSPLVRAIETADIACTEFATDAKRLISESLTPSAEIDKTLALVASHIHEASPILLVGHEPHLSTFASALVGSQTPILEMKKASLVVFELYRIDAPRMRGVLTALLPPRIGELSR